MSYANNKGADQPTHPRSLISTFVVRCLDSVISLVSVTTISSLILAPVAEQASLSLTSSETVKDTFCRVVAHVGPDQTDCTSSRVVIILKHRIFGPGQAKLNRQVWQHFHLCQTICPPFKLLSNLLPLIGSSKMSAGLANQLSGKCNSLLTTDIS